MSDKTSQEERGYSLKQVTKRVSLKPTGVDAVFACLVWPVGDREIPVLRLDPPSQRPELGPDLSSKIRCLRLHHSQLAKVWDESEIRGTSRRDKEGDDERAEVRRGTKGLNEMVVASVRHGHRLA